MPEYKITFPELNVRQPELYLQLGYGGSVPGADVMEVVDAVWRKAGEIARPGICYEMIDGRKLDRTRIRIGETEFLCGSVIAGYLDGVERFAVFVATAGEEYEFYLHRLKASGDLVSEYVADALGSVIAEAAVEEVGSRIERMIANTGQTLSFPYSPGYCGWHVREQSRLFSLLPERPCGVRLTDSSLMVPIKSVSGIYGLGAELRKRGYACDSCGMTTCYKRRTIGTKQTESDFTAV